MAVPQIIQMPTGGISTGKILGGAVIVLGTVYLVKKTKDYFDQLKAEGQLKADQATTVAPSKGKKLFDLNGKPLMSANLATIASDLENALSYPVDGKRAVRVFKSTPFGYVNKLEQVYLQKFGENLKDRMISRLSDTDWISIKFNFK